jgi:hypothetical protein
MAKIRQWCDNNTGVIIGVLSAGAVVLAVELSLYVIHARPQL